MHNFATALCAGLLATVVVGGATLTPTPAEAAKTPSVDIWQSHRLLSDRPSPFRQKRTSDANDWDVRFHVKR